MSFQFRDPSTRTWTRGCRGENERHTAPRGSVEPPETQAWLTTVWCSFVPCTVLVLRSSYMPRVRMVFRPWVDPFLSGFSGATGIAQNRPANKNEDDEDHQEEKDSTECKRHGSLVRFDVGGRRPRLATFSRCRCVTRLWSSVLGLLVVFVVAGFRKVVTTTLVRAVHRLWQSLRMP